ncbi:hypothetical protein H0H92_003025 [Tricholoma furcatifolium]|nr:hypothetical protein H0H92_003025 [Tricholoma furcatifolium]
MLEAKLSEASTIKKLLDSIKELVTDANFECNEEGITLQAMDNSHVALVSVLMEATGFKRYRCDRPMPLGVNLASLTKVLKCAKDDDNVTLKAADEADVLNLVYEARASDRIAEYDMKLMDIDSDQLGIPDTEYEARVSMPSSEFSRIVKDLSLLGESVRIEVSKEGVRFASEGEAANGSVLLKQSEAIGKVTQPQPKKSKGKKVKKEDGDHQVVDVDADEEEETAEDGKKIKKEKKVKKEKQDEDVDMEGEEEDGEEEQEEEQEEGDDEEEEESGKKRKKSSSSSKPSKKAKTSKSKKGKGKKKSDDSDAASSDDDDDDAEEEKGIKIEMNAHVSLTFSLKYLVNFTKSAALASRVEFMMSNDVPLLVSYDFGQGYIRYYLAPKIGDE